MCIKVLKIFFLNMFLYKHNVTIKKKDLFKFEAAVFITKPEGVIYTKIK